MMIFMSQYVYEDIILVIAIAFSLAASSNNNIKDITSRSSGSNVRSKNTIYRTISRNRALLVKRENGKDDHNMVHFVVQ